MNDKQPQENMPPLGLKPQRVHDEQRLVEVELAIQRYILAGMPIKSEWVHEWSELRRALDTPFKPIGGPYSPLGGVK
jgi:hypothetical protein